MLACGMVGNARSMAKLAAFMANRGKLEGKTLMSDEAWESMHSDPTREDCSRDIWSTNFTKGGVHYF